MGYFLFTGPTDTWFVGVWVWASVQRNFLPNPRPAEGTLRAETGEGKLPLSPLLNRTPLALFCRKQISINKMRVSGINRVEAI